MENLRRSIRTQFFTLHNEELSNCGTRLDYVSLEDVSELSIML